jgi:hypothetical protein
MSAGYMRRCAGKDRHESRALGSAARARLAASLKMRVDQFTVYRCDQCLGWHVGGAGRSFQTRTRTGKRPNKRMRGR